MVAVWLRAGLAGSDSAEPLLETEAEPPLTSEPGYGERKQREQREVNLQPALRDPVHTPVGHSELPLYDESPSRLKGQDPSG